MLQTLKSVSGLGKNKSQNALSLDGQLVTDQILIKRNFHHNRANKSKQYSSFKQKLKKYLMKKIAPAASPPLTHIYNLSFETGIFPESWRISRTIPLFKRSPKSDSSYCGPRV